MYYCHTRYYVPEWRRWLNADNVSYLDSNSINGLNLYAYCGNNTVMCTMWTQVPDTNLGNIDISSSQNNNYIIISGSNLNNTGKTSAVSRNSFFSKGSYKWGLWETNNRFQYNTNWIKGSNEAWLGVFAKFSVLNLNGVVGYGNDDQYIGLKGVLDVLTANAKAGIFYGEDGKGNIAYGIGVKAKASVLSGRGTTIIRIFGKEIELGVSGDLLSVGGELYLGYNDKEGFGIIANGSTGLFGIGFIFRIKW